MRIDKVIHIGKGSYGNMFCKIAFDGKRLSISGVEGPRYDGNARGGCGQIVMEMDDAYFKDFAFASDWDIEKAKYFINIWNEWHLNDLQAGCEHQRQLGWNNDNIGQPCPVCGYKYGHAWLFKQVPDSVIDYLSQLPESKLTPAWV